MLSSWIFRNGAASILLTNKYKVNMHGDPFCDLLSDVLLREKEKKKVNPSYYLFLFINYM